MAAFTAKDPKDKVAYLQKWLATVNFTDGQFVVLDKKEQAVD